MAILHMVCQRFDPVTPYILLNILINLIIIINGTKTNWLSCLVWVKEIAGSRPAVPIFFCLMVGFNFFTIFITMFFVNLF
jgi:hypothetical protein